MTHIALDVNGTKVWVQLEWEQIDAIVEKELKEQIIYASMDESGKFMHPDDIEYNKVLLPALKIVYEYFAGEKRTKELQEQLNADCKTL